MRWPEHVTHTGQMENAYKILIGKPEGKRSLERHRCRWDLKKIRRDGVNWIDLVQNMGRWRVPFNTIMILRVL
jgi:hypothetical protein